MTGLTEKIVSGKTSSSMRKENRRVEISEEGIRIRSPEHETTRGAVDFFSVDEAVLNTDYLFLRLLAKEKTVRAMCRDSWNNLATLDVLKRAFGPEELPSPESQKEAADTAARMIPSIDESIELHLKMADTLRELRRGVAQSICKRLETIETKPGIVLAEENGETEPEI